MQRVQKGLSTRDSFRKGKTLFHPMRHIPALSTQEAAALVLIGVSDRQLGGWRPDPIAWQRFCRDSAAIQVVKQPLSKRHAHKGEVS